jgi:hypothetical protein
MLEAGTNRQKQFRLETNAMNPQANAPTNVPPPSSFFFDFAPFPKVAEEGKFTYEYGRKTFPPDERLQ